MKIKKTIMLDQSDVLAIITDYFKTEHGITVTSKDLNIDIQDSYTGYGSHDESTPAYIRSISIAVDETIE